MFALVTTAFLYAAASAQTPSATPTASQTSVPAVAAAPADPNKKVCRKIQETGSMMLKKTCYTQAEWDAIDRQNGTDTDSQLRDYRSRHSY
jgi:hypothetical protein